MLLSPLNRKGLPANPMLVFVDPIPTQPAGRRTVIDLATPKHWG